MPYTIVQFPDGYRVQSQNGTFLSHKALTLPRAKKQLTAVNINESGGGKPITIPYADFLQEHKTLLGVLKHPTKAKLNKEYADQSEELKKVLRGGAVPEGRDELGRMAEEAYKPRGTSKIGVWDLIFNSPTIKAYKHTNKQGNDDIIIAVRGTEITDTIDLNADATIVFNNLNKSARYKTDKAIVEALHTMNPKATFYGVGHSLGGAIVDNLIEDGLLKEGVSFNPASQPKHYDSTANQRISHVEDPLYNLLTKNAKNVEVVNKPLAPVKFVNTGIKWLDDVANAGINYLNPFKGATKKFKAHSIGSIFGRGACGKDYKECGCSGSFKAQLESDGYSCAKYLKDARAVARKAGYDPKTLDFANDPTHKLRITAPDGTVRKFGRVEYGDFLIWKHLEHMKKVDKGVALKKRDTFHKSHEAIKGAWRKDKYSPNSLALAILW